MIGFGELRRVAARWGVLVDAVERVYAVDWILKGIFDRPRLAGVAVARAETALARAYFPEYPQPEEIDLGLTASLDLETLRAELEAAAREAAAVSGLTLALASVAKSIARFEFAGPLGRRSAAQPHVPVRLSPIALRRLPVSAPLIHSFSDPCQATLRAPALEELAGERLATLGRAPRVRDVYDLWFVLTHGTTRLDRAGTLALAREIAAEKNAEEPTPEHLFADAHRAILVRQWGNALKSIRGRPEFEQAEADIRAWMGAT